MWLLGVIICIKIALLAACAHGLRSAAKSDTESANSLQVYVKDHGFDII